MNTGKFLYKIDLLRPVSASYNTYGQKNVSQYASSSIWGDMTKQLMDETVSNGSTQYGNTYNFIIRSMPVDTSYKALYDGKEYSVDAVFNLPTNRNYINITLKRTSPN